jgi:hypothetical protein
MAFKARRMLLRGGLTMVVVMVAFVVAFVAGVAAILWGRSPAVPPRNAPVEKVGLVEISYDPGSRATAEILARDGAAAIGVMERLVRRGIPKTQPYRLNVYEDGEEFSEAVKPFRRNDGQGGFASAFSGQAYQSLPYQSSPADADDLTVPLYSRGNAVHELSHLFLYATFTDCYRWPRWLQEGLPELVAYETLLAQSTELGRALDTDRRGRWREAASRGAVATTGQGVLAFEEATLGTESTYTSAYLLLRRLQGAGRLATLLDRVSKGDDAGKVFQELMGDVDRLWADVTREMKRGPMPPGVIRGALDEVGDGYRLAAQKGMWSLATFDDRPRRALGTIRARFAIRPTGDRRVDVHVHYVGHEPNEHFLRVSIGENDIQLQRGEPGRIEILNTTPLKSPLRLVRGKGIAWHRVRVTWDNDLEVWVDDQPSISFDIAPPAPDPAFFVMFGGGDGVVYFDDVVTTIEPASTAASPSSR